MFGNSASIRKAPIKKATAIATKKAAAVRLLPKTANTAIKFREVTLQGNAVLANTLLPAKEVERQLQTAFESKGWNLRLFNVSTKGYSSYEVDIFVSALLINPYTAQDALKNALNLFKTTVNTNSTDWFAGGLLLQDVKLQVVADMQTPRIPVKPAGARTPRAPQARARGGAWSGRA